MYWLHFREIVSHLWVGSSYLSYHLLEGPSRVKLTSLTGLTSILWISRHRKTWPMSSRKSKMIKQNIQRCWELAKDAYTSQPYSRTYEDAMCNPCQLLHRGNLNRPPLNVSHWFFVDSCREPLTWVKNILLAATDFSELDYMYLLNVTLKHFFVENCTMVVEKRVVIFISSSLFLIDIDLSIDSFAFVNLS